jgi:hypothetical protein
MIKGSKPVKLTHTEASMVLSNWWEDQLPDKVWDVWKDYLPHNAEGYGVDSVAACIEVVERGRR